MIYKRLEQFRKTINLTQEQLGESFGVKKGQISAMENGRTSITLYHKSILKDKFSLNLNWLETGNGSMFNENKTTNEGSSSILWNVTILETRASAGLLSNAAQIQELEGERMLMPNLPKNEGPYIGLYVEGDSMSPEYNHGDLVVCRRLLESRDFRSDRVYIVVTPSDVMLKVVREIHSPASDYYGHLELKSLNEPRYERQYLPLAGDMQYQLYSVVAHCRYFR